MKNKLIPILLTTIVALTVTAQERWLFLGDSITQAGHYTDYIETWLLLNEAAPPEIINLGLSSETVSGLSEPDHPFPRPYLHNRLDQVLERTKPDVVIACYGMNCGIYHPYSKEHFKAYQDGINKLVADAQTIGAKVILLTPPPYAGRVKPRTPPAEGETYSYKRPALDYNDVLAAYADWILSLDGKNGTRAFSIREPIEKQMELCYPKEPIHPNNLGHELMAKALLQALEKEVDTSTDDPRWNQVLALVNQQRHAYDRALLNDIGHGNPNVMKRKALPLPQALEEAKRLDAEIGDAIHTAQ